MDSPFLNQHVVVRTFSAGVHIGTLIAKDNMNVVLKDARRIWRWAGAFTLNEVSQDGIDVARSKVCKPVPMIEITQAIEIIPTSEKARAIFEKCHE